MRNSLLKNTSGVLIPVIAGAAVAAALAYFLISDDTAELRDEFGENLGKIWDGLKEKAGEKLTDLKSGAKPKANGWEIITQVTHALPAINFLPEIAYRLKGGA